MPGIISSALPRPKPPCAATAWRSTRSPSGRGCCAMSLRVDASAELFGRKLRLPVMMAPVGALEIFDPAGAAASVARGAGRFGAAHMLSSVSEPGLEKVAEAAPDALRIYQLYVRGDDAFVEDRVSRAIASGYTAFCLTVDTAHYSRRERDIAKRYVRESRLRATGGDFQKGLEWRTVKLIKDKYKIPLILKGIATAEDAAIALDHGVEWIYVSNHGGRQLDHGRGAMHVLPEIVSAVEGRAKIMVDGSFCRGSDIVKAIALGADLVGIGRLQCWALAAAGETGIVRMLELLGRRSDPLPRPARGHEICRTRQILSASGNADQPAQRVQRVSAAGHRAVSVLMMMNSPIFANKHPMTALLAPGSRRCAAVRSRPRGARYRLQQGGSPAGPVTPAASRRISRDASPARRTLSASREGRDQRRGIFCRLRALLGVELSDAPVPGRLEHDVRRRDARHRATLGARGGAPAALRLLQYQRPPCRAFLDKVCRRARSFQRNLSVLRYRASET